ncbi:MAG: hypothetical protein ACRCT8_02150, partial [Lacipirellulaceae bacterium]
MRRFPISWDRTLAALGFRRNVRRVKRDRYRRRVSRLEQLEVRAMLDGDPIRPQYVLAYWGEGDTPDQFLVSTEYDNTGAPR